MHIGVKIRQRREELGLTQTELANKLGYKSKTTIAKIETGENDITQSKVKAFAEALNTTPAYLMGWEEAEAKAESLASITLAMFDDDELRSCVEAIVELKKHDPDSFNIISDLVEKLRKK